MFSRRTWASSPAASTLVLRPIAAAPADGREILCTDGVYWRVCAPKMGADGIWEYARDDANCFHSWGMAPTHFIYLEELPHPEARK